MHGVVVAKRASLDDAAILLGASVLRRSGLVAFPTETVYGLGANALDLAAVMGIFRAKGRPLSDPLIVHVPHRGGLVGIVESLPEAAIALADAFWPGPLTLVLPRGPLIPPEVSAGLNTVAVRVPAHPIARALLRAAGVPVAAPSANRFSRPSPTTAEHVAKDLADRIDLIIDGGATDVGIESTIVRVGAAGLQILRPGGISREAIEAVVGPVVFEEGRAVAAGVAAAAPGSLLRHYAPEARLIMVDGERAGALAWLREKLAQYRCEGRAVGLLLSDDDLGELASSEVPAEPLGAAGDAEEAARRLYGALRRLDEQGLDIILGRMPSATGLGLGLRDRLFRAAVGQVVRL